MSRDKNRPNETEEAKEAAEYPKVSEPTSATAEVAGCVKLNIRSHPDAKAEIIEVIPAGTKVVVNLTAKYDKYYEILASSGKKGYGMKDYLKIISE